MTSTQASCVRIWNIDINASVKLSNFVKSHKKQNNCMEMLDEIINKHMVKIIKLPSFFPGPNILYTKSSSSGDALISLTTRNTWKIIMRKIIEIS